MVEASDRPIGVFDSGIGGLTVVRALQELMPQENLIYFGDTARFPYGPRPIEQVREFAFEIMDSMVAEDVKMLVIACNAMSSAAFLDAKDRYSLPIIEVVQPAVRAGVEATRNRRIGVLGTKVTIEAGAYQRALEQTRRNVEIFTQVCPRFVEFVETGDTFSEELIKVAHEYLDPLLENSVDTLILGCTHYPLLRGALHCVTEGQVMLISSAEEVAKDVYAGLVRSDLLRRVREIGKTSFSVSGDPEAFRLVGSRFLPGIERVERKQLPREKANGGLSSAAVRGAAR